MSPILGTQNLKVLVVWTDEQINILIVLPWVEAEARPDKRTVTLSLSFHLQDREESTAFQLLPTQTFPQIKGSFHHCVLIRGKR